MVAKIGWLIEFIFIKCSAIVSSDGGSMILMIIQKDADESLGFRRLFTASDRYLDLAWCCISRLASNGIVTKIVLLYHQHFLKRPDAAQTLKYLTEDCFTRILWSSDPSEVADTDIQLIINNDQPRVTLESGRTSIMQFSPELNNRGVVYNS